MDSKDCAKARAKLEPAGDIPGRMRASELDKARRRTEGDECQGRVAAHASQRAHRVAADGPPRPARTH